MDEKRQTMIRRPDVLKKLNNESLAMIERGLLGDIPIRLRPQRPSTLELRNDPGKQIVKTNKNPGLLASCLPIMEVTPPDSISSPQLEVEESSSPLKKTFSFRDRLARINPFGKDKEKQKLKEERMDLLDFHVPRTSSEPVDLTRFQNITTENKAKRFWFFKKEHVYKKTTPPTTPTTPTKEPKWFRKQKGRPLYVRSKSYEFLPRALEEDKEDKIKKPLKSNRHSFISGSRDAWSSNDSVLFPISAQRIDDDEDDVFHNIPSSISTVNTSTNSSTSGPIEILKRESVQDLLEEFEKAVEMFQDENYLSDSEVYKGNNNRYPDKIENRKSSSFSALPSPRIVKVNPVRTGTTDNFKRELASVFSAKNAVQSGSLGRTARRSSVTDWFVIDDANPSGNIRRTPKKTTKRVRRVSSTKYVSNLK